MAYHCSRLQPDLPVEEESEPSMEEERSRSPKIKQIAVDGDDDAIYGLECPTDESFRNFLNSQASGSGTDQADPPGFDTFENFFDFGRPSIVREHVELKASRMCNKNFRRVFTS
ncbi:hypothetical protein Bca101_072198 [Brassica carinata]